MNIVDVVEEIETIFITAHKIEENVAEIETTVKEGPSLEEAVKILTPLVEETIADIEAIAKETHSVETMVEPLISEVQKVVTDKVPFFTALRQKLNSLICFKKC